MAKFRTPHLTYLRSQFGSQLADAMQAQEDAINQGLLQVTASAQGTTSSPGPIASLTVAAANGVFEFAIVDNSPVLRGIQYFVEYSSTAQGPWKVIDLGVSRNWRQFIDSGTYFFRAYSSYPTSARSSPVYFGSAAAPTAVNGGGAIAGPAGLASQGSGTSTGANGGDGGYGNEPFRGNALDVL